MNQNWKQHFRRMNLDADVRSMKPGDYRKLLNGTPIQPYSTSYANAAQDIVCNVIGNQLVANTLPGGTNQIIGCVQDRKSNRLFFAAWNNTASNNSIYQYSGATGAIVLVMRTSAFAWAQTDFVDMDIVGDILIFTNNRSDIQKINVVKAIAGGTYTPLATELTLIKPPPLSPVTWALGYDNTVDTNRMYGNYFQFFERYVYEDYDYSVFSPSSKVTNSWLHPSGTDVKSSSTSNVAALTGTGTFDGVALVANDRILLLAQNTASQNGIWLIQAGAWTRPVDYASGSNSDVTVYIRGGSASINLGQVWRVQSTNVDTADTILTKFEGPNFLTVTRTAAIPATVIGIEYAVRINGSNEFIVYRQEKVGAGFSATHTFYNDTYLFTVPDSDTLVWNDNVPLTTKALKIFKNIVFLFNNTEGYNHVTTTSVTLSLTAITSYVGASSAPTKTTKIAKTGGRYRVGVMWFDAGGRHSGVHCDALINIPSVPNGGGVAQNYNKIHVDLTSVAADVPSWAVRASVVMTKELTSSFFVGSKTQDIFYYKFDASGNYVYTKTLSGFAAVGTAIDITSLTKDRLGYTWQAGDRIIIKGVNGQNIDVEILGQAGRYLLTRVLPELDPTSSMITTQSSNIDFQIYTPKTTGEEPFYETGLGATGDIEGDVELIINTYCQNNGGYSQTAPYTNDYSVVTHGWIESMAVWNKNYPIWVTQSGRPDVKTDTRQLVKYNYLRFGQEYILNANFLGLNTFYALDEQALPIENGAGTRLAEAGEILVAIHEVATQAVFVGQGFIQTAAGSSPTGNLFLTKTDSVIGDTRKYLTPYGSQNQASVVSREGHVYFLDRRQGCVMRRAQDGLSVISDYGVRGLISTLCAFHDTLATSRIIAGWDPQYDCYCISFIDTSGPTGITLYYHEDSNAWVFMTSMMPEMWGILNQDQFAFLNGACWAQTIEGNYNNFFGVQYNRQLDFECSPLNTLIHIWDGVEVDVENIYVTGGSNEIVLQLYHKNGDTLQAQLNYLDFQLRESDRVWRSAFFRWMQDQNFAGQPIQSKYYSNRRVRGQSAFMTIVYNGTDRNPMKSITIYYTPSMQSNP